jgi:phosphocarrier protein
MLQKTITIKNKLGLHARAANKLIDTSSQFGCNINIRHKEKEANGKSIMAVMLLAAPKGSELEISADGSDEQLAVEALCALIDNLFDEGE